MALTAANDGQVQFIPARTGTFFWRQMTGGAIYVVAGDGKRYNAFYPGYSGNSGPATKVLLGYPAALALDRSGGVGGTGAVAEVLVPAKSSMPDPGPCRTEACCARRGR